MDMRRERLIAKHGDKFIGRHGLTGRFTILQILICILSCADPALCQGYLDVSQCFNRLLQQKLDYSSTESMRLATLAQISEQTYESWKHDATLGSYFTFLPASIDYKDFNTKRRSYFELHKLDFQYYRAISTSSRTLDPAAYGLISNCISEVASKADGFHYLYTVDDAKAASIRFFWRPNVSLKGADVIKISDSTLDNATVVNGERYKGHLYDLAWYKPDPRIAVASPPILLKRDNAENVIRISLVTDPPVDVGFIVIPPVPKPLPAPIFQTELLEKPPMIVPFNKKDGKIISHGTPDCSDCDLYVYDVDVPGNVVSVDCKFGPGSNNNKAYCGPNGEHKARWEYYSNDGNNQAMTMTIQYKAESQKCIRNCD